MDLVCKGFSHGLKILDSYYRGGGKSLQQHSGLFRTFSTSN